MKLGELFSPRSNNRNFLWFFLLFYSAFSLLTFRDYGMTADELDWYVSGSNLLNHYRHICKDENIYIFNIEQASHNYLYPALLIKFFGPEIKIEKFHLLNLLFASLGFAAVYEMLLVAYRNSLWALFGPVALFLTFRFSGDVPANPKDAPFAVLYILGLALIYLFRTRWKSAKWEILILGSLIGITACVRAIGLTLFPLWAVFRIYQYWQDDRNPSIWRWINEEWINGLIIFITSQVWMMACWPYLGSNYWGNYLSIFNSTRRYPWDGLIMFMGNPVRSIDLPWVYLPVWFLVTMPVFLTVFFLFSWLVVFRMGKPVKQLFFLLALALTLQISLYLVLKPIIYNALRHYLFLVPIFCVMGVIGFFEFFKNGLNSRWTKMMAFFCGLNVASILFQLVSLYPYQYVYFNELVGGLKGAAKGFETDYWGASLRELAQWLSAHGAPDPNKTYWVKVCGTREQLTDYFKPNLRGDYDVKAPDYQIVPNNPVVLERDKVSGEEIKEKAIFAVQREGVPFFYVLKLK